MSEAITLYVLGLLTIPAGAVLAFVGYAIWNAIFPRSEENYCAEGSVSENGYYD